MKNSIMFVLIAFLAAVAPVSASAQGLGGLLKKAEKAVNKGKEVLDKVSGTEKNGTIQTGTPEANAKAAVLSNGIEIINPVAEWIDVEPIGLYGVSKSENYGDAYLVMKVTMKAPKESALFGSSIENKKMIAADAQGKVYNIDSSGAMRYDAPEGIPVIIKMNDPSMMFMDIKKDVDKMQVVKIGVNIDAYKQGNLTLKNVPVIWDEEPEL